MNVRFSGMAHIIRPKNTVDHYVGMEKGITRGYNGDKEVKEWRKEFEFDRSQDEVVLLWGKDLENAPEIADWDFNKAHQYASSILKSGFDEADAKVAGGRLLLGRTITNARAALYLHSPKP